MAKEWSDQMRGKDDALGWVVEGVTHEEEDDIWKKCTDIFESERGKNLKGSSNFLLQVMLNWLRMDYNTRLGPGCAG